MLQRPAGNMPSNGRRDDSVRRLDCLPRAVCMSGYKTFTKLISGDCSLIFLCVLIMSMHADELRILQKTANAAESQLIKHSNLKHHIVVVCQHVKWFIF